MEMKIPRSLLMLPILAQAACSDYGINKVDRSQDAGAEDAASDGDPGTTDPHEPYSNDLTGTLVKAAQACLRATENPCPVDRYDGSEHEFCIGARSTWQNVGSMDTDFTALLTGQKNATIFCDQRIDSSDTFEDGDPENVETIVLAAGTDPGLQAMFAPLINDSYANSTFIAYDFSEDPERSYFQDPAEVPDFIMCRVHHGIDGIHLVDSYAHISATTDHPSNCNLDSNVSTFGLTDFCAETNRNASSANVYYTGYSCDSDSVNDCSPVKTAQEASGPAILQAQAEIRGSDQNDTAFTDCIVEYIVE
jgi:hypothetical protein